MKKEQYDEILSLFDSFVVIINTNDKLVELLMLGDKKIGENISYDILADKFVSIGKFNSASKAKMMRFLNQLKITNKDPFTFLAKYEKEDNELIPTLIKGVALDDARVIISFSSEYRLTERINDDLTHTISRQELINSTNKLIEENKEFILFVLDLDDFMNFKYKYGTMFGDILIIETAAALKNMVRDSGYICREHGDRFIVVLKTNTDYDTVHALISRARKNIMQFASHNIKNENITATIGCITYPNGGNTFEELFIKAMLSLNRGKKKGKNCFIIYNEEKCGKVSDYKETPIEFGYTSPAVTNFNIAAGVYEIINRDKMKDKNFEDALSLLGNYFLFDRINLFTLDAKTKKVDKIYHWHSPLVDKIEVKTSPQRFAAWHQTYDKNGIVRIVQVDSNKNLPIYPYLKEDDISALLAFDLTYLDTEVGLIRFEMHDTNRFWSQIDVASLNLISKLFAIFLYKENEAELFEQTISHDTITNLYNYTKFGSLVYEYLNKTKSDNYSVINFCFENFLHLSDMLGTTIIDSALKMVAEALTYISDKELYCRFTEDRFFVWTPNTENEYLINYVEKLDEYIQKNFKYAHHFKLRAGICVHDPSDLTTKTLDKANIARKKALSDGLLYKFFTGDLYEKQQLKYNLELHQKQALINNEFKLYLQPKIDTKTNKIAGAEALTRWYYKNETMLFPDTFIPIFEENGFIKELDLHVFENVCKFQRKIIDLGYEPIVISVNLSMYQKNFNEYIEKINEIREKYDIPANYLEIEITETTYVKNEKKVIKLVKDLHNLGYKVAMDDFGTGYSNLSSLATFDFDTIKLDKNFCSTKTKDKEKIILSFVVGLAKKLDINVLCEGVETKELVDYLKQIGCTLIQGYYFDKPMPEEDLIKKYFND